MSEVTNIVHNPAVRKYGLWILGGLVGVYFLMKHLGGSGGSVAASQYAADLNAQNQYASTAGAQQLAAQTEANNAAQAAATLNAQSTIAETQAAGSTLSQVIQAQDILPATVINAVAAQNQTTLQASAQVAAAGVMAVPGSLKGAADAIAATEQPWNALAVGESAQTSAAFNSLATTAQSSVAASSSASRAGSSAAVAANQSTANTVGTVAEVAALALL